MKVVKVSDSSLITENAFDDDNLAITMTSGKKYMYHGVTLKTAIDFTKAKSKGKFFNDEIKGEYEGEEII